jgi:hypothetical protein
MSGEILEWSYNPWRVHPGRALGGLVGGAVLVLVVVALRLPLVMTLVLSLAAVAPLAVVFLPFAYRLDDFGLTRRCGPLVEKRSWQRLRRAVRRREGVLLTPFRARSWLDAYLGFFLAFPPAPEPSLTAELDRILARHGL